MIQHFIHILLRQIFCHVQVHIQVVAAVLRCSARNFSFKIPDKGKHAFHQRDDVLGLVISSQKQIESCANAFAIITF